MHPPKVAPLVDVSFNSILVATDFSPASGKALRYAVAIAQHYQSSLCLLHVVSSVGFRMVGPEMTAHAVDLAKHDAQEIEDKLARCGMLERSSLTVEVRDGDVWDELQTAIELDRPDLVVVGTHSRTGLAKIVLGSVAERVFRQATCPVLTVGPHCPLSPQVSSSASLRPLLFPTDFGKSSLKALPYALSLANHRRTRVVLLHALSPVPENLDNRWYTAGDVMSMRARARVLRLEQLKSLVDDFNMEVDPICVAEFGDPADTILRTSKELAAEAIVMGLNHISHGESISHIRWLTTYEVVCNAECPVLTVRT